MFNSMNQRHITLGLCFLVALLEGYDLQAIGVAAPNIIPLLGLSAQQAGWCFSAAVIGLAIGAITGGWLSDRYGRKTVLLWSVVTFGAFTLVTALAFDFYSLFLARLLAGLGFGGAMPNLIALASEASPKRSMTTSVVVMFGGLPLGGATAALFALYFIGDDQWQILFVIGGILPFVLAPLLAIGLPDKHTAPAKAASTAQLSKTPWNIQYELFGRGKLTITISLWIAFAITLMQLYLLMNWMPAMVVAKGLPKSTASSAVLWFNIASIPGAFVVGRAADHFGARWPMLGIYTMMAMAMLLLALQDSAVGVIAAACLAGVSVIGAQFTLYGLAPHFYAPPVRGSGVGAAVAAGRIGSIAGPLVAGLLMTAGLAVDRVVLLTLPLIAAAALSVLVLCSAGRKYLEDHK